MDRNRVILALALSLVVLFTWPFVMRRFFPPPVEEPAPFEQATPQPAAQQPAQPAQPAKPAPQETKKPSAPTTSSVQTQAPQREIEIDNSPYWRATFSSKGGGVATSWIIDSFPENGINREIKGADGQPLQLISQNAPDGLDPTFGLRLPWIPELAGQLNSTNFHVDGLGAGERKIVLQPGDEREIRFVYSSPTATAWKSFKFHGGRFVFDVSAEVTANGSQQPTEIVLGPRIGDQSDKQTGSYAIPPQILAFTREGKREQIPGAKITPPFATITRLDVEGRRIMIDKPLAADVNQIKIVADKGTTFVGFARVEKRELDSRELTLDHIPEGTAQGNQVAQGIDVLRQQLAWAGITDHYFAMLAVPRPPTTEVTLTNVQVKSEDKDQPPHDYPSIAVPVDSAYPTHVFVGPKDRSLLAKSGQDVGADLDSVIDYGFFSPVVRPLITPLSWSLSVLAKLFNNYGWAIVSVTVLINLLLSPLRFFSSKKMKQAAKHQPRMKELQDKMKKLKENPKKYERELQQLQQEQVALMKEANPLGGCMPLLLQMPIFWAVYLYLGSSLDVRHQPWILWLTDLSRPDPYKILPIVMCVTMIASTMLTPQPQSADPSMKMQRVMMTWLMPIMLTWFFFFSAPSGLVLYWMVSNIVGVGIQLFINRRTAEPKPETEALGSTSSSKSSGKGSDKEGKGRRKSERRGGAEAEGF
jgi:YidC/Oxa1 family membrane protein insertase